MDALSRFSESAMRVLVAALCLAAFARGQQQQEVCFEGWVMDSYCIDRGTLLDNPTKDTLLYPDLHTIHCLVDVGSCANSVFEILSPTPNADGVYCRAYQIDSAGRAEAVRLARAVGSCSTCDGAGDQVEGFRATFYGTVTDAGSEPPTLTVTRVFNSSVGCPNGNARVSPVCDYGRNRPFMKLHGSLMLLGWGLMLPSGVLVARFFKHRPGALWFRYHRTAQILGLVLATAGWIVALVRFDVFFPGASATSLIHGTLGVVTMSLGLLQPINAFFRPHPAKAGEPTPPQRRAWEILHKGSGYFATSLSVITIALGLMIIKIVAFPIVYLLIVSLLLGAVVLMVRDRARFEANAEGAQGVEVQPK